MRTTSKAATKAATNAKPSAPKKAAKGSTKPATRPAKPEETAAKPSAGGKPRRHPTGTAPISLPADMSETIRAKAGEIGAPAGHLAAILMQHALDDLNRGRIAIGENTPEPAATTRQLH